MPFKSEAQRKWMFVNKPKMAKEWAAHTPKEADLPEHVKKSEDENAIVLEQCFIKIAKGLIRESTTPSH